jgi:hypothetical protein
MGEERNAMCVVLAVVMETLNFLGLLAEISVLGVALARMAADSPEEGRQSLLVTMRGFNEVSVNFLHFLLPPLLFHCF